MGGTLNHPQPQNMSDWMRLVERRLITQERRNPTADVMARLGPGLSRYAHQVFDWNTENTWQTGHYWSDVGSLHSPDSTKQWLGFTRVASMEGGVQEMVTLDGTIRKQRPFSFNPGDELPTFGDWVDMGGSGSGGGPPTGAAGGDLTGFYPNPLIADGAVDSANIADGSIQTIDIAPGVLPYLAVQDENTTIGTDVRQLDFQGAGVTVVPGTGELVVSIPGGTGPDEVIINTAQPADPNTYELWYDPDATLPPTVQPDLGYTWVQGVSASVWTIDHPLTFQPNVTVTDSAGDQVEGTVTYLDADTVQIAFSAPFAGTAYLS